MNNLIGLWTVSNTVETFTEGEAFDTKEEAIDFGREHYEEAVFYVGQIHRVLTTHTSLGEELIVGVVVENTVRINK